MCVGVGYWTSSQNNIDPYAHTTGCDCYGLARVVYQEELAITLPDYLGDYASADEHGEVAALIAGAQRLPMWVPVTGLQRPLISQCSGEGGCSRTSVSSFGGA
ncbi:hypothetical protein ACEYYB_09670 [Paracoccus sp. p4-l81]|uniref:hypothetical protein n=1 Tax=Paracoccus sp. p4-l81 TaxID=3342806 RepID=UPI0035B8451A